ncbi:putative ribonuclease H-like domain-containing protein [Tanacetum coccineum]
MTHPHPNRRFVPQAVLTRSGKINTASASVNIVVRPVNTAGSKPTVNHPRPILNAYKKGYSQVIKPFNKYSTNKNSIFNKKVNIVRVKDTTTRDIIVVSENKGKGANDVKASACWVWKAKNSRQPIAEGYEDYDGGFVSFRDGKDRISVKGKIKYGTLVFDDVYFCKELKYNLLSVLQICGKKNNVLFTNTECLVLSFDFKLLDESQVLLRVPRKDNIYSVDLKSVVPTKGLTCLFSKVIINESNLWHRRLGHINFKNMNKLVRGNLVRGLPSKIFENDHSCIACQKGKQHKAFCKAKLVNSISKPLHMLNMNLFGLTNVKSLMKKSYCLVVTDDFSRFSWVFFLATKDETSGILKTFITEIENQLDYKVKVIRSENGTEFKNSVMSQFYEMKGIKREFSIARTSQQNGVAERKNRTLIEAVRTMLVNSKLPTTFWAEAVNTTCYVLNRVLVIKPNSKKPYELIHGRTPLIDFIKPFGYPVTILNIRDHLGKFDGKANEGFFVGYSVLFAVDSLSKSMNYVPVVAGNQTNGIARTKDNIVAGPKNNEEDAGVRLTEVDESEASNKDGKDEQDSRSEFERLLQQEKQTEHPNSTNSINTISTPVSTAEPSSTNDAPSSLVNAAKTSEEHLFEQFSPFKNAFTLPDFPNVSLMNDNTRIFAGAYDDEDVGRQANLNNLETTINVSSIPTTRINKDHPIELIIRDLHSALLTRRMLQQNLKEHCLIEAMQEELLQFELQKVWTLVDLHNGKRAIGTKWVLKNKKDERGIVVRNKARLVAQGYTQEEGIDYDEVFALVARIEAIRLFLAYASYMGFIVYQIDVNSAFLYGTIEEEVYVCQPPGFEDPHFPDKVYKVEKDLYGLHQALRAWDETLSTYLLENEFRRGTIDKTLFIKKDKSDILLVFQISSMGEFTFFLGLQVQQKEDGIFISQDKYVADIIKKFGYGTVKTVSTPMEPNKALVKDKGADNVDVHLYRLMIGSLMYLMTSRPDIIFAVCAYARFQVTPKTSYLHAMKRIFRYLKDQPKLGLWYPRDSPFDLEAFSNSDYTGASLDRKSTTGDLLTKAFDVGDEAVHKELGDRMERAATTDSSLEAEQDNGNINKTQSMATFWQTATTSMLKDGDMGITATIDGKVKVVSEASIRRHLKLEDYDGISTLSTVEIFEKLALMGAPSTSQPPTSSPSMPTTYVAEEAAPMPYDSPLPRVYSLRSDEGSLTLNELMVLCTSLSKKVESLESDLKQTKQTYGAAYTKLIMKVKKLEHKVKSIKSRRKIGAQTQGRSDEDLMYETGVYDYPEGFTGPSISITTAEPVTAAGEGVSTDRAIPKEVSTAEPDMDVTLAEALVDLLKSGNKNSPKPKSNRATQEEASRVAIYDEMDNIQAMIEADEQLATRVQYEE